MFIMSGSVLVFFVFAALMLTSQHQQVLAVPWSFLSRFDSTKGLQLQQHDIDLWLKNFDLNADGHLDGYELMSSFAPQHEHYVVTHDTASDHNGNILPEIQFLVDSILQIDDQDGDGRLSRRELIQSHEL
ncbi:hypothetical protein MIR68_005088 [Amoeboaphelidium protococcarum]|nr:hypothetical protein MIR68_005088 [Amoeboaphelidium protococcarum]